ncbi:MAG: hypothetical protein GF307_04310, partial [candidate division Zixibacteria bacterium]|nr:hypothetical protein [candidate division Zixibacteria bacterium]
MKKIFIVFKKELLDVIRDRRTIISMVVVPIVLFPVMTIGFSAFVGSQVEKTRAETQKIAFIGEENYPELYNYISRDSSFIIVDVDDVTEAIGAKYINSAIEVREGAKDNVTAGDSSVVKIYYDGAEIKSEFTRNRLRGKVNSFSDSVVGLRLADLGAT